MHYAILAAGESSRMGSVAPKALVTVGGKTLVGRMLDIIAQRSDVQSVSIIVNARRPEIAEHVSRLSLPYALNVISAQPPTAAHSLARVVSSIPRNEKFIVLTVDTVFHAEDFHAYVEAFAKQESGDGLMAVTRFIDDEKPLYVGVGEQNRITFFGDIPEPHTDFVSAGIYGLGGKARDAIDKAMSININGLRELQRALLLRDLDLRSYEMGVVFDVDRPHDLEQARKFLCG